MQSLQLLRDKGVPRVSEMLFSQCCPYLRKVHQPVNTRLDVNALTRIVESSGDRRCELEAGSVDSHK